MSEYLTEARIPLRIVWSARETFSVCVVDARGEIQWQATGRLDPNEPDGWAWHTRSSAPMSIHEFDAIVAAVSAAVRARTMPRCFCDLAAYGHRAGCPAESGAHHG